MMGEQPIDMARIWCSLNHRFPLALMNPIAVYQKKHANAMPQNICNNQVYWLFKSEAPIAPANTPAHHMMANGPVIHIKKPAVKGSISFFSVPFSTV